MAEDVEPEISLSERDLRALAMELALQLPRNQRDAEYVLRLMQVGYDFFLSAPVEKPAADAKIVRPRFSK